MKLCEFLCPLSSDHSPVKLTLHSQSIETRGRGYCDLKSKINEIVSNFNEFEDARVNWVFEI